MTDTSELQKLLRDRISDLGDMPIPVEDGEYCSLLAMAGMEATSEATEREIDAPILEAFLRLHSAKGTLLSTIARLTAERDALVEALNAIQAGLDRSLDALNEPMSMLNAQELSERFANDICEVIRHAVARALVRDGGGADA